MSGFKFVLTGDADGNFAPADKEVRSHAIRTALQRRPSQSGTNTTAHLAQDTVRRKAELKGRFRLSGTRAKRLSTCGGSPVSRKGLAKHDESRGSAMASIGTAPLYAELCPSFPAAIVRLGSDSADPFNSLPIPSNPRVDSIVRYFLTRFNLNSTTVDKQRPWFPYAMQSAVIMHSTIALAAQFWAASMPGDLSLQSEVYRHQGEVMRFIRPRLGAKDSFSSTNDDLPILAAISMLSSIEAFQGHFDTASIHLRGLLAIIQARGGPETVEHDYILCRSMNWTDIQVASGLGRLPRLPMFHTLGESELPYSILKAATTPSLHHLDRLSIEHPEQASEPRRIFATLRHAIAAQASTSVPADNIRIIMNTANRSILHYLHGEVDGFLTPSRRRFHALVSAAHLFLYVVIREIPPANHMTRTLSRRLRVAMESLSDDPFLWTCNYPALIWIYFVGFIGTDGVSGSEDGPWLIARLRRILRSLNQSGGYMYKDLRQLLAGFLWEEKFCQRALDDIWSAVEECDA